MEETQIDDYVEKAQESFSRATEMARDLAGWKKIK
jgi:hypothetical protein